MPTPRSLLFICLLSFGLCALIGCPPPERPEVEDSDDLTNGGDAGDGTVSSEETETGEETSANETAGDRAGEFPVLVKIETFEGPAYPEDGARGGLETYDYRIEKEAPVPETKTDTLVVDAHLLLESNRYEGLETIADVVKLYATSEEPEELLGYRGWTHAHFVRSLSEKERGQLAREIEAYAEKHGVNDPVDDDGEMGHGH